MKVRCISPYPTDRQIEKLGKFYKKQSFGVSVGKEYLVLGITFLINSALFGTGVIIDFHDDDGNVGNAPLFLFEITDRRSSKYWEAKFHDDGSFQLQPSSFYKENYHDLLSDGVEEVMEDFKRVLALLEAENE